jgi:hypothetical protein
MDHETGLNRTSISCMPTLSLGQKSVFYFFAKFAFSASELKVMKSWYTVYVTLGTRFQWSSAVKGWRPFLPFANTFSKVETIFARFLHVFAKGFWQQKKFAKPFVKVAHCC